MMHISQWQDTCRKCQECAGNVIITNVWVLAAYDTPSVLCSGYESDTPNFLRAGNVHEMSTSCPVSYIPERSYWKCEGNVLEMSCVLATGHVPDMLCVLAQKMCLKFCPILCQEKSKKCQDFLV